MDESHTSGDALGGRCHHEKTALYVGWVFSGMPLMYVVSLVFLFWMPALRSDLEVTRYVLYIRSTSNHGAWSDGWATYDDELRPTHTTWGKVSVKRRCKCCTSSPLWPLDGRPPVLKGMPLSATIQLLLPPTVG